MKRKSKPYTKSLKSTPHERTLPDPLAYTRAESKPSEKYVDKPLSEKAYKKYLRGYAERQAATSAEVQAAETKPETIPPAAYVIEAPRAAEIESPRDGRLRRVLPLHVLHWYMAFVGVNEESMSELEFRVFVGEHGGDCAAAADALNAWTGRREKAGAA